MTQGYRLVDTPGGTAEVLPGETLVSVTAAPVHPPARLPDPVKELMRLTAVSRPALIGTTRPVIAGLPMQGASDAEPHFRLFEAVFGRDAIICARLLEPEHPALMRTTLTALASLQGLPRSRAPEPRLYDNRDEEAGRIPHEVRDPTVDPVAQRLTRLEGMGWPMYRTDDATLLFARECINAAVRDPRFLDTAVTQRDGVRRTMGDALVAALRWAEARSRNPEGLIESTRPPRAHPGKPANTYPVWQDSWDSAFRAGGTLCSGPVCFIEMQGYFHDVLTGCAALADRDPAWARTHGLDAAALRRRAERLQRQVIDTYFVRDPRGDFFAYGAERMGAKLEPLKVLKSQPGHLLDSGIFEGAQWRPYVDALVASLLDPAQGLVCASGIRTCSSREARFRPGSYHSGSVWAVDNHLIADGLRRHGYAAGAAWVDATLRGVCRHLRHYAEFVRGDDSPVPSENQAIVHVITHDPHFGDGSNCAMQPPQPTQAWTVAAYIAAGRALGARVRSAPRVLARDRLLVQRLRGLQRGGPLARLETQPLALAS